MRFGPGRPKLPEGQAKSVIVRFRVSRIEFKELQAQAKTEGISLSAVIRKRLGFS